MKWLVVHDPERETPELFDVVEAESEGGAVDRTTPAVDNDGVAHKVAVMPLDLSNQWVVRYTTKKTYERLA